MHYIIRDDFSDLSDLTTELKDYDAFICTLGTQRKHGKENFIKVDYEYPLIFAKLAKACNIPYYGLLTSQIAKSNSMFFYVKLKGQVEEACKELGLHCLAIF